MAKIGRNYPCPCKSGLKYKKCHGDPVKIMQAKHAAEIAFKHLIQNERIKKGIICKHGLLKTEYCKDCKVGD